MLHTLYRLFCHIGIEHLPIKPYVTKYPHNLNVRPTTKPLKLIVGSKPWIQSYLPLIKTVFGPLLIFPQEKYELVAGGYIKIKYKVYGSIERYKARFVAKGYIRLEMVDYIDTLSPISKITMVRVLLALESIKH